MTDEEWRKFTIEFDEHDGALLHCTICMWAENVYGKELHELETLAGNHWIKEHWRATSE